ncbi:PA domain-containing protein [Flavobacterium sp. H122]|uniref:PA domain-containing protein n=1 Tax=Flavobacterium sp. H122 TaxID=2529860 RepID=UPI0010AB4A50|nr:PA domain-containing protein [Flavobacterium sp. H122]
MKKRLLSSFFLLYGMAAGFSQENVKLAVDDIQKEKKITKKEAKKLRKKHEAFLADNKINRNFYLTKSERKSEGIPPNKYNEQEWLLSMNPSLGYPTHNKLNEVRKELEFKRQQALNQRIPGDASANSWVERGPNNVGGRTRALIFDPGDATNNTVIAGGVSGGLWKNTNISSASSTWTKINTFPEHVNVQNITVDPNNTNTWYVGTGESYVFGDVNGNGIWKTTDRGTTWERVYGGGAVTSVVKNLHNLEIVSPSTAITIKEYATGQATWTGGNIISSFTAPIVLMNDGTAPTDDGCTAAVQNYSGKIVLIRRGTCSFESKAVVAQNAGAVGVIIMNNAAGGSVFNMAEDAAVAGTIPTIMISKEDGDLLVANLANLTGTFKPSAATEFSGLEVTGVQFVNDLVVKNNAGVSEIYAAMGDGQYSDARNGTLFDASNFGMFKSVNGGATWTKLSLPVSQNNHPSCPNDIEIGADGDVWVSTTNSWTFGDGGGRVFHSSDNGASFTLKHTVQGEAGGERVEIEASNTTPDKIYVLSELKDDPNTTSKVEVKLELTTNGFATAPTVLTLPAGNESRETTYGFTGAQAFYDMMIESDPVDDKILYVGGIDLYRTVNATGPSVTWATISNWTTNVHSDQHAMVFKPGNSNIGLFGNDGGVYYSGSLSATTTPATSRNNGFNVTQFVGAAVMPNGISGASGDFFVAGSQDNGTQYYSGSSTSATSTVGASAGLNNTFRVQGGDGGKPLFDQGSDKYYITNYVYNDNMVLRNVGSTTTKVLNDGTANAGLFYPAMALDSANDIVYSDFTSGGVYQIRRYSNIRGKGQVARTNLSNALLTTYATALTTGKTTPSTLYVGTMNGRLLKVANANGTAVWSNISGSSFVGSVSDVEFGANDNQIFVTMHNYGVNNIWYTSNGGANWYQLDGDLPDLPVKCILPNPLNAAELMIGTELGVWYASNFNSASTVDQALVWKQAYNGMSNVKVTDLDLQANSPTAPTAYKVYAATYGRGVFSGAFTTESSAKTINPTVTNEISVYPTISNGNVRVSSNKNYGITKVELFDVAGRNVFNNSIEINGNNTLDLNLGTQAKGNYILKLSGEGFEEVRRLIIE